MQSEGAWYTKTMNRRTLLLAAAPVALLLVIIVVWRVGASRNRATPPTPTAPAPEKVAKVEPAAPTKPAVPTPAPLPADVKVERTEEVKGAKLSFRSDHTIALEAEDRWGKKVDVVYESVEYLRKALPTLKLSLKDGVVEELEQKVGGGGGGETKPAKKRRRQQ